jgi:hypothetical protein
MRRGSRGWRTDVLPRLLAATGWVFAAACGGPAADLSHLEAQGEAGQAAVALMTAHGGLDRFLGLADLEYAVTVERLDPSGAVTGARRELHRFQAGPPRRYLLRRTGAQVLETGLLEGQSWTSIDGVPRERTAASVITDQEIALLSVLHRAPFCLADPGVILSLLPEPPAGEPGSGDRRLAAEMAGREDGGAPERYLFVIDGETGLLEQVLFEEFNDAARNPFRLARVERTEETDDVLLVSGWSLSAADGPHRPRGLPDTRWFVEESRPGNGFTDQLYHPRDR